MKSKRQVFVEMLYGNIPVIICAVGGSIGAYASCGPVGVLIPVYAAIFLWSDYDLRCARVLVKELCKDLNSVFRRNEELERLLEESHGSVYQGRGIDQASDVDPTGCSQV